MLTLKWVILVCYIFSEKQEPNNTVFKKAMVIKPPSANVRKNINTSKHKQHITFDWNKSF